jgi:hypothetical protein
MKLFCKSLLHLSLISTIISRTISISSASSASSASASSTMKKAVTLVLFDVDGTLIHGSSQQSEYSAHARAFGHAIGRVFNNNQMDYEIEVPSPLLKIDSSNYHGCTDGLISLHLAKVFHHLYH